MSTTLRKMTGWRWLVAIIVAATAQDGRAAPEDTRFSVQFYGAAKDQIRVIVQTGDLDKGKITRADFSVAFFDADHNVLRRHQYRFVDTHLPALIGDGKYVRVYSHQARSPITLTTSKLSITVEGSGNKADGTTKPPMEAEAAPTTLSATGTPIAYAEETTAVRCQKYASGARKQAQENINNHCSLSGTRWDRRFGVHYNWCLDAEKSEVQSEATQRAELLDRCKKNHLDAISTVNKK